MAVPEIEVADRFALGVVDDRVAQKLAHVWRVGLGGCRFIRTILIAAFQDHLMSSAAVADDCMLDVAEVLDTPRPGP